MTDEEKATPSIRSDRTAMQFHGTISDTESNEETHTADDMAADIARKDANVVKFEEGDPENPMNWPKAKKLRAVGIVSFLTLLSPFTSTICAPAVPDILSHFDSNNRTLGSFVTTVFVLGYASGPIVIAPMSEMYGRAIMYKSCIVLFVVFNVACAVADSLGSLIVFRLFAGVMGSAPVTLGPGTVADVIPAEKRTIAMAAYVLGTVFGPSIGPIVGGYLAPAEGWRWVFWLMAIVSGATAIVALLIVEETYPYVLLKRKTKRLQEQTGNANLRSALDTGRTPRELFAFSIFRPLKMLLSPIVLSLSLYAALVYSYSYICFTTFGAVFRNQYGFNSGEGGLAALGIGIGSSIGVVVSGVAANTLTPILTKKNGGGPKPEYGLPPMILGAFCTPVGLFWYGWSAEAQVHWIIPILGTVFIGMGVCLVYMPVSVYLVQAFTVHAASVTAASTILRSTLGAVLPLAGPSMYEALGLGWGNSLLGFVAIAFGPLPFVFFFYGERIRNAKIWEVDF